MKLIAFISFAFVSLASLPVTLPAAYTVQEGKLVNEKEVSTVSVQEHYSAALEAYEQKNWRNLIDQSAIVIKNFPATPFAHEARYYLGVGYFNINEYQLANREFSTYLKKQTTPKYFEEAIKYKFAIAEKFKKGAKKHLMGWRSLPRWVPANEEAIAIYDEVIAALPHNDLGAQALYGKGQLLLREDDFQSSLDAFQTLLRRFPKHPLAPEAYFSIVEVYLSQCQSEYPDPDYLDLAQINVRKFGQDFPLDERLDQAKAKLLEMKEVYATSLYDTGLFFERTKKPQASIIYYSKAVAKYTGTKAAARSRQRLVLVQEKVEKLKKKQKDKEKAPVVPAQLDKQENPPAAAEKEELKAAQEPVEITIPSLETTPQPTEANSESE